VVSLESSGGGGVRALTDSHIRISTLDAPLLDTTTVVHTTHDRSIGPPCLQKRGKVPQSNRSCDSVLIST
jgi:hypothetical protein